MAYPNKHKAKIVKHNLSSCKLTVAVIYNANCVYTYVRDFCIILLNLCVIRNRYVSNVTNMYQYTLECIDYTLECINTYWYELIHTTQYVHVNIP